VIVLLEIPSGGIYSNDLLGSGAEKGRASLIEQGPYLVYDLTGHGIPESIGINDFSIID
jgi:hypothetical protein